MQDPIQLPTAQDAHATAATKYTTEYSKYCAYIIQYIKETICVAINEGRFCAFANENDIYYEVWRNWLLYEEKVLAQYSVDRMKQMRAEQYPEIYALYNELESLGYTLTLLPSLKGHPHRALKISW